ncbi:MAG: helix-turn-helix transcriptional regulator [Bacteroidetes bacterium]|nr:MAG: helix-turn-helix transcriptional regulator [Bacteroidota bacterium]
MKRNSKILSELRKKRDNREYERTRTSMLLAASISKAIKSKGLTKSEFAEKMGKNPSVVTKWLSGVHNFTSDTLTDIQQVLGISLLNLGSETSPILTARGNTSTTFNVFIMPDEYKKVKNEGLNPISFATLSNTQVISKRVVEMLSSHD